MAQSFDTLESLYYYLKPKDDASAKSQDALTAQTLFDVVKQLMLDARGQYNDWERIKSKIQEYLTKSGEGNTDTVKNQTGKKLHIIGPDGVLDFGDGDYWGKQVKKVSDICPDIPSENSPVKVTLFVTRSSLLSPATRGVDDIDFFLNYIPPIIAAQMTPYLDVSLEFLGPEVKKPQAGEAVGGTISTSTPSMMRFLLGTRSSANAADAMLIQGDTWIADASDPQKMQTHNFAGMEMFLMPQTLTSMDSLGRENIDGNSRLVPVKPFLPFASIEGFDITVANAGAGAFSHKKGILKLKLHDKSRIGEFAEFIRGGGTHTSLVWTTYGWLAPLGRNKGGADKPEDAYADFINRKMLVRDCWQPVNTQFSFDASGQVAFTIELVTKGTRKIQEFTLDKASAGSLKNSFEEINRIMETVSAIKEKIDNAPKFSISVAASQLINAAASSGNFANLKDVKDVGETISALYKTLTSAEAGQFISADDAKKLKDSLSRLNTSKSDSGGAPTDEGIAKGAAQDVGSILNKISSVGKDPFLLSNPGKDSKDKEATDQFKKKEPFFPKKAYTEMSKLVTDASKAATTYNNAVRENAAKAKGVKPIDINSANSVVSFGKLFTNFVASSIVNGNICNELEVFFYGLNDQCGPASGISIAEFPIDVVPLAYAYAEELKSLRTDVLTIEQFVKLVIDTQFTDVRSIAYGMRDLYAPPDPGANEPKKKDEKTYESKMSQWFSKYGSWKPPMIEMIIETGDTTMSSAEREVVATLKKSLRYISSLDTVTNDGTKKIVTRIHIYDKQNNPHKLAENVISSGNELIIGLDEATVEAEQDKDIQSLEADQAMIIKQSMEPNKKNGNKVEFTDPSVFFKQEDFIKENVDKSSTAYKIPLDRRVFKAELMKHVPKIIVGTNGTMVSNASVASKTDGLISAINMMRAAGKAEEAKSSAADNSLEDPGHMPLRVNPVTINLTTQGVPTAGLYQTFFIDFNTGTSLDNIYLCTNIQHSIAQGKFQTAWTFAPSSDGYGRFVAPPALSQIYSGKFKDKLDDYVKKLEEKAKEEKKAAPKKK